MVVTYTIQELRAIGDEMRNSEKLKDWVQVLGIAAKVAETIELSDPNYVPTIQKLFDLQQQLNNSAKLYSNNNNNNINSCNGITNGVKFVSQIESSIAKESALNGDGDSQEPLTQPVVEFFRKAQQNFYSQANIDPTKVRRLSEIEAELVADVERVDIA